jgi:hypothetical protein
VQDRQIYSLLPLTARPPPRDAAGLPGRHFIHYSLIFVNPLFLKGLKKLPPAIQRPFGNLQTGAGERSRTSDQLITNQLLYQLSYASVADFTESCNFRGKTRGSQGLIEVAGRIETFLSYLQFPQNHDIKDNY